MIDANTKLVCLIGKPVAHSFSPAMHNAAFEKLGLNCTYLAFEVQENELGNAVNGLRALGIRGANVTIPHKIAVMEYLDEIDGVSMKIGAVNTIVNENGRLKGYNTDAYGALAALKEKTGVKGKAVLMLGAGGAAHAIGFALAGEGAALTIADLDAAKARELAKKLGADSVPMGGASGINADILVNATPVGMHPNANEMPVAESVLKNKVVFDIVYNPAETKLLKAAKRLGCKTVSGLDMLVLQGAKSFELWTGKKAPVDVMKKAVLNALKGK